MLFRSVCVGGLPVIFAVDRAGIVGNDGETHQGILDISYLAHIPGMTVMAPRDGAELKQMLSFAVELKKPAAIRYPRGAAHTITECPLTPLVYGRAEVLYEERGEEGKKDGIALLALGSMVETAVKVRELLSAEAYHVTVVNMRFVSPLDTELLERMAKQYRMLVTMEENVHAGGFGEKTAAYFAERGTCVHLKSIALPDHYIEHGDAGLLRQKYGLTAEKIAGEIRLAYHG